MRGTWVGLGMLGWVSATALGESCTVYRDSNGNLIRSCSAAPASPLNWTYPSISASSPIFPSSSVLSPGPVVSSPIPSRVIASTPVLAAPSFDFMTQGAVDGKAQDRARHNLGWGVFTGATGITADQWATGEVNVAATDPDWARADRIEKDARLVRSYARMEAGYVKTDGGRTVVSAGATTSGSQYGAVETQDGGKVQLTSVLVTDRGDGKKTVMLESTGGGHSRIFVEYEVGKGGVYKPVVSGDYKPTDAARTHHLEYLRHMGVFHDPKASPDLAALAFKLPGDAGKVTVRADQDGNLFIPNFKGVNDPRFVTVEGKTYLRSTDGTADTSFVVSADGHLEHRPLASSDVTVPVSFKGGKVTTATPLGLDTPIDMGDRLKVDPTPPDPPKT